MRKAVFFDLDGTLLPLDMDVFIRAYYVEIQKSGVLDILQNEKGLDMFNAAIGFMMGEHGMHTNEDAFCRKLEELSGVKRDVFMPEFIRFYKHNFRNIKGCTRCEPLSRKVVDELKRKNYRLVLATNPFFPRIATDMRIGWAGLKKEDFEHVTYYENSRYCKPDFRYFEALLNETGLAAGECYMVGNSVEEDLCAAKIGFEVFFLKDYCIGDVEKAPECASGSYSDLLGWAKSLPAVEEAV